MYIVCPFGERRADLRAATNTAAMIVASRAGKTSAEEYATLISHLSRYLIADKPTDTIADEQALKILEGNT